MRDREVFDKLLIQKILRLCEEAYPDEACGLVVDRRRTEAGRILPGERVFRVIPCTNIQDRLHKACPKEHPETGREAYAMDPEELRGIADEMEARGEEVKAIYHSHTDCMASFSRRDADHAVLEPAPQTRGLRERNGMGVIDAPGRQPLYRDVLYLVVEVRGGTAADVKWFVWDDAEEDFIETDAHENGPEKGR